ncbi:MAG: Antitoxin ParD1 [Candidatus Hydrogenedentota bacterium]|jgi:putative addiction module CopG family antidote
MAAQNFELSERHQAFIREAVASGTYENESAVVNAAMELLEEQTAAHPERLEALRSMVREGFDELDRGEGISVPVDELGSFFREIMNEVRTRPSNQ